MTYETESPGTPPSSDCSAPLVEARDLTVRFGDVTALDGLDVIAPPGQVLAILGPNGAGKSTFIRSVATLLPVSAGRLRVLGIDAGRHPAAVRRVIGLAGQFAAVEPTMTGRENLEMVARLFGHDRRDARSVARRVIELLDLDDVAGRRTSGYSGGQRRRLDLGASLVGAPRLLLLDEPTTGLDPSSRIEVWEAVRGLVASGTDIVLTTHYLEEADELADQVVVIDHGRAIASGTVAELKSGIGRDLIEVGVADGAQLGTAASVLEAVVSQPAVIDRSGRRVRARVAGGTDRLTAAITGLAEAGVPVDEIALRHPTLDEVFVALTADRPDVRTAAGTTEVAER